jgi:UDP-N-acetylmuramoyl-L-alanyl-D-glutamate--2,6-diaminopimelate ligase
MQVISMRQKKLKNMLSNGKNPIAEEYENILVSGVQHDSRKIKTGDLFVAIKGFHSDGHDYLSTAEKAGAAAAIVERKNEHITLPQFLCTDSREALAVTAANFYKPEIDALKLVGITGTNGKTTTSYLIKSILDNAQLTAGLIGTIAYFDGKTNHTAANTTPEANVISKILYELYQKKFKSCVLEVSSHALDLKRVDGFKFDAAVFTNLTHDHLDYHKTEEAYFLAKSHLFDLMKPQGAAIFNIDDKYGARLSGVFSGNSLTFSLEKKADVYLKSKRMDINGSQLQMKTPAGELIIETNLIGKFNIQNILAAVTTATAINIPLKIIKDGIEKVKTIPGRMEAVQLSNNIKAFVDYAHTPDALQKTLEAMKEVAAQKIIVVFGAGGDRDKSKRPLMGKIGATLADLSIITSDNPRTENADKIIEDVQKGITGGQRHWVVPDRKKAIQKAVQLAQNGDIILIAGKGHETYQDIEGVKYPFDDKQILKEAENV